MQPGQVEPEARVSEEDRAAEKQVTRGKLRAFKQKLKQRNVSPTAGASVCLRKLQAAK